MFTPLKKIRSDLYDKLIEKVNDKDFFVNDKFSELAEEYSEDVKINGQTIMIDIDARNYKEMIKTSKTSAEADWKIAQQLYKDFVYMDKNDGVLKRIPKNLMFEKEFWAYLNLVTFYSVIKERYFSKSLDDDSMINRIKRVYLCYSTQIDRTGLRWLWVLADSTFYNGNFELTKVALDFIDPFKAAAEGILRKSEIFLKAFALAIKKLDCNSKIRNNSNRTIIPKHIRNYACSIELDGSKTVEELSNILVEQIRLFI